MDVLTVDQAAERLGVTPGTIRRWINTGTLKAHRVGPRFIRIRADDLDALLSEITPDQAV